jgi:prevent-host-death family protein
MKEVSVYQAKRHLSKLLQRVAAGEEITITNRGVPVAHLVPAARPTVHRELGVECGRLMISDDFDAPLRAGVLAAFLGGEKRPQRAKR